MTWNKTFLHQQIYRQQWDRTYILPFNSHPSACPTSTLRHVVVDADKRLCALIEPQEEKKNTGVPARRSHRRIKTAYLADKSPQWNKQANAGTWIKCHAVLRRSGGTTWRWASWPSGRFGVKELLPQAGILKVLSKQREERLSKDCQRTHGRSQTGVNCRQTALGALVTIKTKAHHRLRVHQDFRLAVTGPWLEVCKPREAISSWMNDKTVENKQGSCCWCVQLF